MTLLQADNFTRKGQMLYLLQHDYSVLIYVLYMGKTCSLVKVDGVSFSGLFGHAIITHHDKNVTLCVAVYIY